MNKRTFSLTFLLAFFMSLTAYSINIKGKAINSRNEPLEETKITLLSKDSRPISDTVTDKKGTFEIDAPSQGDYLLVLSAAGYRQNLTELKGVEANLNLGAIMLEEIAYELAEVAVTGKKTIRKIDRQIIFPTQAQINSSTDGLNLLSKMSPDHLRINNVKETVTFGANGQVRFQINGMNTGIKDILALQPEQVMRIEYYDHPGLQFGEERPDAVLNYIVRRTQGGGVVATKLSNALNTGFGKDRITTKLNHKQSEFSLNYFLSYEQYKDRWTDQTAAYHYPDKEVEQITDGIKKPYGDINQTVSFSYNLLNGEKYMFNAQVNLPSENWDNSFEHTQTLNQSAEQEKNTYSKNKTKSYAPSVDLYYIRHFAKEQQLSCNVVGTYVNTDYNRTYRETTDHSLLTDFESRIKGAKYSGIGEIAYKKTGENTVLDIGASYKYYYLENNYTGSVAEKVSMNKSHLYAYVQLTGTAGRLEYYAGIAGKISSFNDSGDNSYRFGSFLPNLKLRYNFTDNLAVEVEGSIKTMDPPPGYLNNVYQPIDYFTVQKGNPGLHPYRIYKSALGLELSKGIFSLTASAHYDYYHQPVMGSIYYENGKFIETFENQKNFKEWGAFVDFDFEIIEDKLSLYWTNAVNYQTSRGLDYRHSRTFFDIGASLNYYYKNWDFEFSVYSRSRSLWGEEITSDPVDQSIDAGYKIKNIRLGAGINNLFQKRWSAGWENLSGLTPVKGWTYIGSAAPLVYVTFSWNISWGKKYESRQKELYNQDSDAGILNVKDK